MMIDDFLTFFFAGQETTANTLGFCFLELGKNQRVLEKYVLYFLNLYILK
jgi:cytochrome P450